MTTINLAIMGDRILMTTDGLATGRRPQKYAKMMPLPHLKAVIASRGQCQITTQLPILACQFDSLPEMLDGLASLLRKKYGLAARIMPGFFKFDVVIAGYYDDKPIVFSIDSKTWRTVSIDDGAVSPAVNMDGIVIPREAADNLAIPQLRKLMLRQRSEFGDIACGGFAQLTTVLPNGTIITRKLCDFN